MRRLTALAAVLCFWAQSVFAVTVTPIGHNNFATANNTLVITTTANISTGDVVLVCIEQGLSTTSTPTAADAAGNTYSGFGGGAGSGFRYTELIINNALAMASGNSITLSWGTAPTTAAATAMTMTGIAVPAATDGFGGIASGSTTSPTTSNTNSTQPDQSVGCIGINGPVTDTFTQDPTFTDVVGDGTNTGTPANDSTIHMAYASRVSTGAHSYSPTLGTARSWIIALKDIKIPAACPHTRLTLGVGC
jgi:predicted RecA/RadA family phage recombinase